MSVTGLTVDALRQRLPQVLDRLAKLGGRIPRLPRPSWPLATAIGRMLSWRMLAAAVLLGGIVHICATLLSSVSTTGQAYRLLAEKLPLNRMIVLPLQTPGQQILPFLPPDALYAMCRYDLSGGPLSVSAVVPDAGWALSLHTAGGSNFYVLPGQRQRPTEVSFLMTPSGPEVQPIPRGEGMPDTRIVSPTQEGVAVLRAPLRGLAWTAETEAILKRATCTPVRE